MRILNLALITVALVGLHSPLQSQPEKREITEVSMHRPSCPFGNCSDREVVFRADKSVYLLERHAGQATTLSQGYLPSFEFKSLIDFLYTQKFFGQQDTPPTGPDGGEGVIVTVVRNGQAHSLKIRDTVSPPTPVWGVMMAIRGLMTDIKWIKYESGIRGTVFQIGEQNDGKDKTPRSKMPVIVHRYKGGRELVRATTNEEGKFDLLLLPGSYWVTGPTVEGIKVTVPDNGFANMDIEYRAKAEITTR